MRGDHDKDHEVGSWGNHKGKSWRMIIKEDHKSHGEDHGGSWKKDNEEWSWRIIWIMVKVMEDHKGGSFMKIMRINHEGGSWTKEDDEGGSWKIMTEDHEWRSW